MSCWVRDWAVVSPADPYMRGAGEHATLARIDGGLLEQARLPLQRILCNTMLYSYHTDSLSNEE